MRSSKSHLLLPFGLAAILVFAASHPIAALEPAAEPHAAEALLVEAVADCSVGDVVGDGVSCDEETEELIDEVIDLICGEDGGAVVYTCTEDGAIIWAIGCAREN